MAIFVCVPLCSCDLNSIAPIIVPVALIALFPHGRLDTNIKAIRYHCNIHTPVVSALRFNVGLRVQFQVFPVESALNTIMHFIQVKFYDLVSQIAPHMLVKKACAIYIN